jgi:CAAX protease family protein
MTEEYMPPSRAESGLESAPPPVIPPNQPFAAPFSLTVSVISALVLLASLLAIVWFSATLPKLQRLEEPDRALELMVSRTMEAQEGLARSPMWQQWITKWMGGSNETEQVQAIEWYRELAESTGQPESRLRLAILQGEFGQGAAALRAATAWKTMAAPMPLYAELIEAAYTTSRLEKEQELTLQSALAEAFPDGWFYNILAARLAQRAGDEALYTTVAKRRASRGETLQRRSSGLMIVELTCLMVGSVILVQILRRSHQQTNVLRLPVPGVPPPWPGDVGMAVLLRGGAMGAVLSLAFLSLTPAEHVSLRALAIPVANVPLLGLAYVYLLKPAGLSFRDGFGLRIAPAQVGRLLWMVIGVVAAGLWGEWAMGRIAERLSLTNHWTEWFDPDLVWAPPSVLAISLLEYVVLAPIFEELAFRGLLFAVLRRRLSFLPAALLSASIFALAHGYGWIGFISVLWSGLLWAWVYEKTGSLIPGMMAHALNNLLVCLAVMALLR